MKQTKTQAGAVVLALLLTLTLTIPASAAAGSIPAAADRAAAYLCRAVPAPQVGSIGGEWTVLGLARGDASVPQGYWETYQKNLEAHVKACSGVLHRVKYTEYARVALTQMALGKDPRNVAGYDMLAPLYDGAAVLRQGINGPIWALLALDAGGDQGASAAVRQQYVEALLSRQLPDGGWCLGTGQTADPDVTAMALQALAGCRDQQEVQTAVNRGLACLSGLQDSTGGFSSWGEANLESTAQTMIALCRLNIPLDDPRFVKNGCTLTENLLHYQEADGSFRHTADRSGDLMATEQAFLALTAAQRAQSGKTDLYDMRDTVPAGGWPDGFVENLTDLWSGLPARVGQALQSKR